MGQEVDRIEDFKVAVDFWIELRSIDDGIGGRFQGDLFHRKRVAQDVLTKLFTFRTVFGGGGAADVPVEKKGQAR